MRTLTMFRRAALATVATATLMATAQDMSKFPFLMKAPAPAPETASSMLMKAPLNTEKPKGAKMFASVFDDYERYRHFAYLYVNEPNKLDKIYHLYPDDGNDYDPYRLLFGLIAGCYGGDGYYYGYRVQTYSFVDFVHDFVKVDPNTGKCETITEYPGTYEFQNTLPLIYDMAYNPKDGKIYAIGADAEESTDKEVYSMIGTVDPKTGTFKKLACLKSYYFGAAFDYDGNLYGITWTFRTAGDGSTTVTGARLDRFDDEFEVDKKTAIRVNEAPYLPYYQHGLEFDYTTGDLYWAACNTSNERQLIRINPETAATEVLGTTGMRELISGLYIPYQTAYDRTSPARVNGLTYAFDPEGANKTTLSWTNPTTQWNRKELKSLAEVNIYRDDMKSAPIATLDATGKVGEAMSFTDEGADRGIHKYYVVPSSVKGQAGIMDSISCFIGRDLPGSPENIQAKTEDGASIILTWDAPTRGDSDGWFDKDITYTLTRTQDGKVVAKDIKETTFHDETIEDAMVYTYSIVAKNAEGEGVAALSPEVLAGHSIAIPFYSDFPNATEAGRFSVIDANGDGTRWTYDWNNNKRTQSFKLLMTQYKQDDYVVSPSLKVKKDHNYRVTWTFSTGRYGYYWQEWYQDVRIVGGKEATLNGLNEVYADYPELALEHMYAGKSVSGEFKADHDGDHYVAFHLYTDPEDSDTWMYLEEFLVEEILENDLEASLLDTPGIVSSLNQKDCPNVFKVTLRNPGMNTQKDYKVEIGFVSLDGKFIPFADTTDVPELGHNDIATIEIKGAPDAEVENGEYRVAARVILAGDENEENNLSNIVDAKVDENPALNIKVTKDEVYEESNTPLTFYTTYSAYQTIYNPSMTGIKMEEGKDAYINRLAWEYIAEKDINGTEIEVYLGQSNKEAVSSGTFEWIADNQEKVWEGTIDFKQGLGFMDVVLEKPFEFDPDLSIVVTVLKKNASVGGEWPVKFIVIDFEKNDADNFHTMGYRGNEAFRLENYTDFQTYAYPQAPVIYMSVPGAGISAVEGIEAADGMEISYENGMLTFAGIDVREVSVWSVDGKLVKKGAVAKGAVALDVTPGLYVVKATDAEGVSYAAKVRVAR